MTNVEPYRKDKIGSHLSYPLKFGELVSFLSPAVEQLNIQVWFCASKAPRQNELRDRYLLLEVEFWSRRPESPWHLFVRPLPRSLHAVARDALIPEATGRLRDWLLAKDVPAAKHPPRWNTRSPSLRVYFDPAKEIVEYEPA
jgi:hypothetical protein